jgi:hypothetical protein
LSVPVLLALLRDAFSAAAVFPLRTVSTGADTTFLATGWVGNDPIQLIQTLPS